MQKPKIFQITIIIIYNKITELRRSRAMFLIVNVFKFKNL